jgi:hypothetical protein
LAAALSPGNDADGPASTVRVSSVLLVQIARSLVTNRVATKIPSGFDDNSETIPSLVVWLRAENPGYSVVNQPLVS